MVDTKAKPATPAAAKPAYVPTVMEYDEASTKALKSGAPQEPSPLKDVVAKALETGKAHGVGYGDEYKKNTVLAHLRKAVAQLDVPAGKVLRTYDRSDYKQADGTVWPHIGFKFVDKPAAKAKTDEPAAVETAPTA